MPDDLRVNNSFGVSLGEIDAVSSLQTSRHNPQNSKLKEDLIVQGKKKFRATHQAIPKLSLQ